MTLVITRNVRRKNQHPRPSNMLQRISAARTEAERTGIPGKIVDPGKIVVIGRIVDPGKIAVPGKIVVPGRTAETIVAVKIVARVAAETIKTRVELLGTGQAALQLYASLCL